MPVDRYHEWRAGSHAAFRPSLAEREDPGVMTGARGACGDGGAGAPMAERGRGKERLTSVLGVAEESESRE